MSKCFYNDKIPINYFKGWSYVVVEYKPDIKTKIQFDKWYWHILGFTGFQRYIIYWCWKKLFEKTCEYWECGECCK